jgi:hypothetical protein
MKEVTFWIILVSAAAAGLFASEIIKSIPAPATESSPVLPFPTAAPGPIEVELQHTSGRFTFRLGGSGYPVVVNPSDGKRWILLPVKED